MVVSPLNAESSVGKLVKKATLTNTIEFWYSIPTVFKIGQLQSEYSLGIITVGIQSETFFAVGIQSQYSRIVSGYEASDMKSHSFCVRMKFW
jgi:hypothetical protein